MASKKKKLPLKKKWRVVTDAFKSTWAFPKIVVFLLPNHPFVHRIFHYKPSILGENPIFGNTHLKKKTTTSKNHWPSTNFAINPSCPSTFCAASFNSTTDAVDGTVTFSPSPTTTVTWMSRTERHACGLKQRERLDTAGPNGNLRFPCSKLNL